MLNIKGNIRTLGKNTERLVFKKIHKSLDLREGVLSFHHGYISIVVAR